MPWTEATLIALIALTVSVVWATSQWADIEPEDKGIVLGLVLLVPVSVFLFAAYWLIVWRLYTGAL